MSAAAEPTPASATDPGTHPATDPATDPVTAPPTGPATEPVVSLKLQTALGEVKLFTVIATLGAPLDVTAANLAIETFLPMDPRSAARLAALGAARAA